MSATLSGLLTTLALPTSFGAYRLSNLGFLAWFSLIPFYLSLKKSDGRDAFKKGFLFGFVFYGVSLYWIFIALHTYGNIPLWGSLLGTFFVVFVEALFLGIASSFTVWVACKPLLPFILSLAWVVQDFVRGFVPLGGFPWSSIAYTQHSLITLLQIMDITGAHVITFLIVFANAILGELWIWARGCGRANHPPTSMATMFLILFSATLLYGHFRLAQIRKDIEQRETIKIAMVQGNIPQDGKWLEEETEEILDRHLRMTQEIEKQDPQLIIWPEAAFPEIIPPTISQLKELKMLKTPLLMGAVTYEGTMSESWSPEPEGQTFTLHNSAVLIQPGGVIFERYDKHHLVPMGEYVPFEKFLYFLNQIVPAVTSFSPGREWNLLGENFGVTICYEDLFPEISRTLTQRGANFLVNLTNDGWYEHSSAVFQHFDFSRYRAIENRRALVRATNTGVTGFFSPTGEVIAQSPVFQEATLVAHVPLGGPVTFYNRHGDFFAWGCVGGLGLIIIKGRSRWLRS